MLTTRRSAAATAATGLIGLLTVGGCSGRYEVTYEPPETFNTVEELASVSRAVVELEVTGVGELQPLPEDEDGPSIYAHQFYDTRVLEVLATTEEAGLGERTELTLGIFRTNPGAAPADFAEQSDGDSELMRPGETIVAFIDSLSDVGMPDAYTIVRSDQGRYDVDGEVATYRGDGPMAGSTVSIGELRDALERSGALGTALDREEPGTHAPPTFPPGGSSLPTSSTPATR